MWQRSSWCESSQCVEVDRLVDMTHIHDPLTFTKSSFSSNDGSCVETSVCTCSVYVRDSKDPGGPVLRFTPEEWKAFTLGVKDGEFD